MPHIHLSTSANLVENVDIPDILRALVDELAAQESIQPDAIKAYHSLYHTWAMGEGAQAGFASCVVSILEGRSEELRCRIADAIHTRLEMLFQTSLESGEVNLTLEIREMAKPTYRR